MEIRNYSKYLNIARKVGIRTHLYGAMAVGGFYCSLYGYYSYSFYVGSYLVTDQIKNTNNGETYSSGDILSCFLGIIYGVFSLGIAAPNFKAIAEGRVAGKLAFDVIERVPKIPLDDK